ncbi:MAG TPA: RodZ domain-containing protein [Moraxellaceae bacterium]
MTDELNEESRRDEADYLSFMPGQRLQKARELRGLSVEQVARELNLSARFVQAMEADAYKELPEPAFVRGYMRRYAQLVKLSPDDIAGKFDQCYAADQETPPPDARPVNPIQLLGEIARPRRWKKLLPWISLGFILVLLLGFLWNGLANRKTTVVDAPPLAQEPPAVASPAPAAVEVPAAAAPATAPAATPVMNVLPQPAAPSALPAPAPAPAAAAPAVAAPVAATVSGPDSLVITLSAESWVSVRDASQPLITSGNKPAGQISLRGKAPFYVNIGNAPAATLALNGKAVDLKPHTQGAVANLTVKP